MGQFDVNFSRGLGHLDSGERDDDRVFAAGAGSTLSAISFRALYPECFQLVVQDQGQTSSCVGQALATAMEFSWARKYLKLLNFSPMGIYALARKKRGWLSQDRGCYIRDAAEQMRDIGICLDSFHQFNLANLHKDLDQTAYEQCSRHRIQYMERLDRSNVLEVLSDSRPVVGGITVYRECVFGEEAQRTGLIRTPRSGDILDGGHALCFTGFDIATGRLEGINSWGPRWGDHGWFSLPMEYLDNPTWSSDFWTLRL